MRTTATKRIGLNFESWLEALLDDSSFIPLQVNEALSVFTGTGLINGTLVAVYGHNPKINQGFVDSLGAKAIFELMQLAHDKLIPIISLCASSGVSVSEGLLSGHEYTKVIVKNIELSGIIPQISVIISQTMGAPAYSATLTDFVLFNKVRSSLMVTGPGVIKEVTGEDINVKDLGGSEVHSFKTGIADFVDKDIYTQLQRARALVGFLPSNAKELAKSRVPQRPLKTLPTIPKDTKNVFDMDSFIAGFCDASESMEYRHNFGESAICQFAYIGGHAFGIMANRSMVNAGVLDCDSAFKCARFLRICDCYNLPILNLIDVPGFMPGAEQEHQGLLKNGARLCQAMQTRTPRFSIIIRKCYGAAAFIMMQTKAQGGEYVYALDTARIAVMGYAGAKSMLLDESVSEELYLQKYEHPQIAKDLGIVDEIVSLKELRLKLVDKINEVYETQKYNKLEAKNILQIFA